jgi:hypothetical protein
LFPSGAGKVLAIRRQGAEGPYSSVPKQSILEHEMKHQRHIDASTNALREARQTRTLIADIGRIVQILDSDIAAEEEQARVFDPAQAEYPMLARTLTARRDNLRGTIAALEQRLNLPAELFEPA